MTSPVSLSVPDLTIYLARAVKTLADREEDINRLNEFPIPDHDTGTNLLATCRLLLALVPSDQNATFGRYLGITERSGEFLGLSGQMLAGFINGFLTAAGDRQTLTNEGLRAAALAGLKQAADSYPDPHPSTAIDLFKLAAADPALLTDIHRLAQAWETASNGLIAKDAGAMGVLVITGVLAAGPVTDRERLEIENSFEDLLAGVEPNSLEPVLNPRPDYSFQVLTDSAADLTKEEMEGSGISMIPLRVIHRGKVYGDGVNLDSDRFYHILETDPVSPTTSLASKVFYQKAYQSLVANAGQVLSIHLSSQLSGTFETAQRAAAILKEGVVKFVDSRSISLGLGYLAKEAAIMASKGIDIVEAKKRLDKIAAAGRLLFTVRTLRYLHRGGRIGGGSYLAARLTGLKPIMGLVDGKVASLQKVLGSKKVRRAIINRISKDLKRRSPTMMAVATAGDHSLREILAAELKERFSPQMMMTGPVGALIGIHAGPGAWGVFYVP